MEEPPVTPTKKTPAPPVASKPKKGSIKDKSSSENVTPTTIKEQSNGEIEKTKDVEETKDVENKVEDSDEQQVCDRSIKIQEMNIVAELLYTILQLTLD